MGKKIAAVEGGGTSFEIAICDANSGKILDRKSIQSRNDPATTLTRCAIFLGQHQPIVALGIAVFGPIGVKKSSPETYGRILNSSPKLEWRNVDILTPLAEACGNCPTVLETDVNAPAVSEYQMAKKEDCNITSTAYITVGTGVGVGLVVNGQCVHGRMHPEGGHIAVQPLQGDKFGGYSWGRRDNSKCPYNGIHTVEGLASSVALTERLQTQLSELGLTQKAMDRDVLKTVPDNNEIWDHAANALANLCASLLLLLSVEKIVLGGGVMQRELLIGKIRTGTQEMLNGYLEFERPLSEIICLSRHGADAGLLGAIALAQKAYRDPDSEDEVTKRMKQEAYGAGLWHGVLVGVLGTALIFKYGWLGSNRVRA